MERKTINTSSVPTSMYIVEKNYINRLRENDENVIDSKITQLYYGPVLTVELNGMEFNYFAPVLPDESLKDSSTAAFANGMFCELDFRHMIPCSDKVLTVGKYDPERTNFFISNHDMLKAFALETYRNVCLSFSCNQ